MSSTDLAPTIPARYGQSNVVRLAIAQALAGVNSTIIYRRYQRTGDPSLDESFFQVLWSRSGDRTAWIDAFCETGQRTAPQAHA